MGQRGRSPGHPQRRRGSADAPSRSWNRPDLVLPQLLHEPHSEGIFQNRPFLPAVRVMALGAHG